MCFCTKNFARVMSSNSVPSGTTHSHPREPRITTPPFSIPAPFPVPPCKITECLSKTKNNITGVFTGRIHHKGWYRDITSLGKWGNGDVEMCLSAKRKIDYAVGLAEQPLVL